MDTQHISAWMEMLSSLGFSSSVGRTLLFNACLGQKDFIIRERRVFGEDTIHYHLFFKEDTTTKKLACTCYDATLRKAIEIPTSVINGVDVSSLETRMRAVNWQMPIEDSSSDDFIITDQDTWTLGTTIDEIIKELEVLSSTDEGLGVANTLKYKYWVDASLQSMIPHVVILKSKYELNQRFYIVNGDGITASEAYRFLINRWTERKILAHSRAIRQHAMNQKKAVKVTKSNNEKNRKEHPLKKNAGK